MNDFSLVDDASPAMARLALSRERLRHAMERGSAPAGMARLRGSAGSGSTAGNSLRAAAMSIPGVAIAVDVVQRWWANHPLHSVALVARESVSTLAVPIARRSPMSLVLGALLAGALLARLRPWRWLPRSLMFAGLLPQIASRLLASVPLEAWLNALASAPPTRR